MHVGSFGGGVVLFGSPDAQHPDELGKADSYDIGPRGQIVAASDVSGYTTIIDKQVVPVQWSAVYGIANVVEDNVPYALVIGKGKDVGAVDQFYTAIVLRTGEPATLAAGDVTIFNGNPAPPVAGTIVTVVQLPGTVLIGGGAVRRAAVLMNLGAREGVTPRSNAGMYTAFYTPGTGKTSLAGTLTSTDTLGTSANGEHIGGNSSVTLFFRGITAYNNFVFGWGFDSADATNGEGPARVMFSNLGNPLKWGNDNVGVVGAQRVFTDSDAIVLGDAGEMIRGALKWNGKLYFGTNSQLHYIAGFGRDSFIADGANPVAKSYNIVGPYALVEGPDKLMYGVSDQGLWNYDGANFNPLFQKLVGFDGHSIGYWDLIWTDPTLAVGYPGKTNQDLVWMAVDWDRLQVLIGIPFCNATLGYGIGNDTVVIKYHPRTGGFTRQVFLGTNYTAANYVRRAGQQRESRIMGTATTNKVSLQRYGFQTTPTTSPVLPTQLPVVTFGPYDPFGPDGDGVVRRCYLTVAWEAASSLPLVFGIVTTGDTSIVNSFTLTVGQTAPGSPVAGDVWLDTSQTDTSIGNATAGTNVRATGGYLAKTYSGTVWRFIAGSGENGTRGTIPIPLIRRVATRITITATCVSAAGRFQFEGLGLDPGGGSQNA